MVSNVKKNNLSKSLFTVLLLLSSVAGADQKYPAADFQPTVVYQDSDYIAKSGSSSSAASKQTSNSASEAVDPKYPAANFQPKVVYNDPGYQHNSVSVSSGTNAQGANSSVSSADAGSAAKVEGDSSSSYLVGLVLFAIVGFILFNKKSDSMSQTSSRTYEKNAAGLTGVAKYLNRKSGTGVARYLEKQVKSASTTAVTGVAKYMAKQTSSGNSTKAEAKTGVEKYMRNRG